MLSTLPIGKRINVVTKSVNGSYMWMGWTLHPSEWAKKSTTKAVKEQRNPSLDLIGL